MGKIAGRIAPALSVLLLLAQGTCFAAPQVQVIDVGKLTDPTAVDAPAQVQEKEQWKFQTEQEWIIDSIGRDIAEILTYAKYHEQDPKSAALKDLAFHTEVNDKSTGTFTYKYDGDKPGTVPDYKFTLTDYLWSTKNYQPYVKQILQNLALTPQAVSEPPPEFLKKIADSDMPALIAENERVSKALSAHPLDAGLHEQAALLLSRFNIEEYANNFTEDRPQLSRGCVHLAMARALNDGKLGLVGRLADVSLEMMSVRDGVIIPGLDELEKTASDATTRSILRAFRMRATHDCRIYNKDDHTPLEESQYYLRFCNYANGEKMLEELAKNHPTPPIYLFRCIANTCNSVQVGHAVSAQIVPVEIAAFAQDCMAYKKLEKLEPAKLMEDLNLTPKRCLQATGDRLPQLNVISWDDIAAFHARHILNAVCTEYYFYHRLYGVPELAKKTVEQTKKMFAGVTLQPFAMISFELEPLELEQYARSAENVVARQPQLVTSPNWIALGQAAKKSAARKALIAPEKWFDPPIPFGTAFFFYSRHKLATAKYDLAEMSRIRDICPFFYNINQDWAIQKYGKHPTYDQYVEAFGKQLDYDTSAMRLVASAAVGSPDKFIEVEEKLAREEPVAYFDLGSYCVFHNRPAQAARYFEIGVKLCENSVLVANQSDWLIRYREEHGDKEKAKELAMFAGQVFSCSGLQAMARYYERLGDLKSAEGAYRDVLERYGTKGELTAFLLRNAGKTKEYAAESEKLAGQVFPGGIKHIKIADLKSPPSTGMLVAGENWLCDTSPLKSGVVIVGVNGYQVDDRAQYDVARNMTGQSAMDVIYWDGKSYGEFKRPVVQNNLLGIQIQDYKPGA